MKHKWQIVLCIMVVSVCCIACKKEQPSRDNSMTVTITVTPIEEKITEQVTLSPTPIQDKKEFEIFLPNLIDNPLLSTGASISLDPIVLGPIDFMDQMAEDTESAEKPESSGGSIFANNSKAYIDSLGSTVAIRVHNNKITITDVLIAHSNTIVIPAKIDNYPVVAIGSGAFEDVDVTTVKISEGVTLIESQAFYGNTKISNIIIPASVTEIGNNAFGNTPRLKDIELSETNANYCLVNGVLYNKDKTSLIRYPSAKTNATCLIEDGVITIDDGAFSMSKKLEYVFFPDSIRSIGAEAFAGCVLLDIEIPKQLIEINAFAFADCFSMKIIRIPSGINEIAEGAFSGCEKVETIILEGHVDQIGYAAFSNCSSLNRIDFLQSVTDIGEMAFAFCTSLKSIILPDGVQEISDMAFFSCTSLEHVLIPKSVNYFGVSIFDQSDYVIIKAPKGSSAIQYAKSVEVAYQEQ